MTKKAVFFTTAAIFLTVVIVVTYGSYTIYGLSDKMDIIQTRI